MNGPWTPASGGWGTAIEYPGGTRVALVARTKAELRKAFRRATGQELDAAQVQRARVVPQQAP